MSASNLHYVNGNTIVEPFPEELEQAIFGMGCFWGAERRFWETPGVYSTAAGYAGGSTAEATYQQVCSGRTGHAEVVLVVFDPAQVTYEELLTVFWENHDPTQGNRQGNDVGTQYRSVVMTVSDKQATAAAESMERYQEQLKVAGYGPITTCRWTSCGMPRTITSSTSPRIPVGTAASAAPVSRALSESLPLPRTEPACRTAIARILSKFSKTGYCPGCQTGRQARADRSLSRLLKDGWPGRL